MPNIQLIDPVEDPRWDQFVMDHPFGWICHLSGWKQVLENSFKHMKGYYFALMDDTGKKIQAGLPVFHVKSRLTGNRLVSIPFATLCDPLVIEEQDMIDLTEKVLSLSKDLGCSYLEIRTLKAEFPQLNGCEVKNMNLYKNHYLKIDGDLDFLKRSFHRTCVRKNIKKAKKNNLKVRIALNASDINVFYKLYTNTRKSLGLPSLPMSFIQSIWETFSSSGRMVFLTSELNSEPIASMLLFKFKGNFAAEHLGWNIKFKPYHPSVHIYWEAIKLAYSKGCKVFDFGRSSRNNKGLLDFKRRWGTCERNLLTFYILNTGNSQPIYETSLKYKAAKRLCFMLPGNAYHYFGNFIYNHMG